MIFFLLRQTNYYQVTHELSPLSEVLCRHMFLLKSLTLFYNRCHGYVLGCVSLPSEFFHEGEKFVLLLNLYSSKNRIITSNPNSNHY